MTEQVPWVRDLWAFADKNRGESRGPDLHVVEEWLRYAQPSIPLEEVPAITELITQRFGRQHGIIRVPQLVLEFVSAYAQQTKANSVLDPNGGLGSMLAAVQASTGASTAVAIERNGDAVTIGRLLNPQAKWIDADFIWDELAIEDTFDVVTSVLFRMDRPRPSDERHVQLRDRQPTSERYIRPEHQILLNASKLLAETGVGIFVLGSEFVWSRRSPFRHLPDYGLWPEAAIEIDAGVFSSFTTFPTYLMILRRKGLQKTFVGQLSKRPRQNELLLEHLRSRTEGRDVEDGRWVDFRSFYGLNPLRVAEQVRDAEKEFGAPASSLAELMVEARRGRESEGYAFPVQDNAIYIPRVSAMDVVDSPELFSLPPSRYLQVVIDSKKSDARFVARFFNTELGRKIREGHKSGASIFNSEGLKTLRVLVPPIVIQKRVIEVEDAIIADRQRLLGLENELLDLHRDLWARPNTHDRIKAEVENFSRRLTTTVDVQVVESLDRWMETLPFPLASILRAWHVTAPHDHDRKYRCLVHFFEAVTHFVGSTLLSGFSADLEIYEQHREEFLESVTLRSLKKTDYGTWLQIATFFSKRLRIMLNQGTESREQAGQLFSDPTNRMTEMLARSSLMNVLAEANQLRNKWQGHTGLPGEREAEERHQALLGHLNKLRNAMADGWSNVELVVPKRCVKRRTGAKNEVLLLLGSHPTFQTVERETVDCLEAQEMHILGESARTSLALLPFVQLGPNPSSPSTTCYFYSSEEKEGYRLISFQGADQSEWTESLEGLTEALKLVVEGAETLQSM